MSVTLRKWTTPLGEHRQAWQVFVRGTRPDGVEIFHRHILRSVIKGEAIKAESTVRESIRLGTYRTDAEKLAVVRPAHHERAAKARRRAQPTVKEFWEQDFLPHCRTNNRLSEVSNKEQSGKRILPLVGSMKIKDVGTRELESIKTSLLAVQPPLKPKTVKNHLMTFKRCLKFACELAVIDHVPYSKSAKVPTPPFRHLTIDETDKLVAAADVEWQTMILTAARTGLRIGELLALTWSDIDLKVGRITVSKSLYQAKGKMIVQPTKTNQIRYVPLEPELLAALTAHRKKLVGPKNVFCHSDGRQFTRYEARRQLERAAVAAGLKPFGWHVLRHTFASHLVIRGASLNDVRELLGHTTMTMTLRVVHREPVERRT